MIDLTPYLSRKIDVLAFHGQKATGETLLTQALVTSQNVSEICTGIAKLAQRFLLELLTERGTMAYAIDRGTELLTTLLSGKARTTTDVQALFALAELQARVNLSAEESDDDPADERYQQATLQSLSLQPGTLVLTLLLSSLAGENATVILPIPIVV